MVGISPGSDLAAQPLWQRRQPKRNERVCLATLFIGDVSRKIQRVQCRVIHSDAMEDRRRQEKPRRRSHGVPVIYGP
jgi:hypothetical protein